MSNPAINILIDRLSSYCPWNESSHLPLLWGVVADHFLREATRSSLRKGQRVHYMKPVNKNKIVTEQMGIIPRKQSTYLASYI